MQRDELLKSNLIESLETLKEWLKNNQIHSEEKVNVDEESKKFYFDEITKYTKLIETTNSKVSAYKKLIDDIDNKKEMYNSQISKLEQIKQSELSKKENNLTEEEITKIDKNVSAINIYISKYKSLISGIDNVPALLKNEETLLKKYNGLLKNAEEKYERFTFLLKEGFNSENLIEDLDVMINSLKNNEIEIEDASKKLTSYLEVELSNVYDGIKSEQMKNLTSLIPALENSITKLETKLKDAKNYYLSDVEKAKISSDIDSSRREEAKLELELADVSNTLSILEQNMNDGLDVTEKLEETKELKEKLESEKTNIKYVIKNKEKELSTGIKKELLQADQIKLEKCKKALTNLKKKQDEISFDIKKFIKEAVENKDAIKVEDAIINNDGRVKEEPFKSGPLCQKYIDFINGMSEDEFAKFKNTKYKYSNFMDSLDNDIKDNLEHKHKHNFLNFLNKLTEEEYSKLPNKAAYMEFLNKELSLSDKKTITSPNTSKKVDNPNKNYVMNGAVLDEIEQYGFSMPHKARKEYQDIKEKYDSNKKMTTVLNKIRNKMTLQNSDDYIYVGPVVAEGGMSR